MTGAGAGLRATHLWYWRTRLPERKWHQCRVLARGKMNSALVEFEDGERVVTSRFAVRRLPKRLRRTLHQITGEPMCG